MKNEKKHKHQSPAMSISSMILVGCVVVIIGGLGILAGKLLLEHRQEVAEAKVQEEQVTQSSNAQTVTYHGQTYEYNRELTNILFMGVDKKEEVTLQDTPGTAGQADCIMILSLDEKTQTGKVLQISRDTMTDVDIYDVNGNFYTSVEAQIATQYAYGNGEKSSCWAMEKTVSELLYELPIDAYISLNIDSISTLNDAVGGVTLTIPEDYTEVDPAFVQGTVVTMTGEQAERYVRYRDTNVTGSNNGRMQRQVQYITALVQALKSTAGAEGSYYERFSSFLKPYMVTDMNAQQIDSFANYDFKSEETQYLPGEVRKGAEHDEFYVDEENLYDLLLKTFYKRKN
ncbi:LCP family protein [Ruminococcus sp. OA3]|uniref:LCP family protein n=1 Tax=Ruminococcus sp. OA3 TaxID=2914164 RepID=UPI001F05B803|nr:LCP family protein [Ruminococcus sp. OA3]MCH1982962.1 LCP family protein [Ruminococcus sp. OA3]